MDVRSVITVQWEHEMQQNQSSFARRSTFAGIVWFHPLRGATRRHKERHCFVEIFCSLTLCALATQKLFL